MWIRNAKGVVLTASIFLIISTAVLFIQLWFIGPKIRVNLNYPEHIASEQQPRWVYIYATTPGSRLPLSYFQVPYNERLPSVVLRPDMFLLPVHRVQGKLRLQIVVKLSSGDNPHLTSDSDRYYRSPTIYPLWQWHTDTFFELSHN